MDYEQFLKEEFQILQKAGKEKTNAFLKEVEDYISELEQPDLVEKRIEEILKQVKTEKRFSYTQYKEIFPFVVNARKILALKKQDDYFILL